MPIYEYYCAICQGRFSQLVRRIEGSVPPCCPRCGNREVERLISAASLVRGEVDHRNALRQGAVAVDREAPQAMAAFLKSSGRLEDASGLYGSRAYRELIERRVDGATDADLTDLVDDLARATVDTEATEMGAAVALSEAVDNRIGAAGPPVARGSGEAGTEGDSEGAAGAGVEGSTQSHIRRTQSPRSSRDLGWG